MISIDAPVSAGRSSARGSSLSWARTWTSWHVWPARPV
jgi:hypothetical protein